MSIPKLTTGETVLPGLLRPPRLGGLVQVAEQRLGRARHLRRLAALHLQLARHAHHQQRREGAALGRLVQLLGERRRVEGARGAVPRVRGAGGRHGGRRHRLRPQVHRAQRRVARHGHGRRERRGQRARGAQQRRALDQPEHGG